MLDLRQLRYFIAVAETENIARAAERLHISQSPLSRQIKQLEDQLGVQLFERSKQRVHLTQEGHDLLGEARALMANALRVEAFGRRLGSGEVGRLAIGYVEGALHANVLGPALRRLRRASPSVALSLQGLGTTVQFERLRQRTLDLGFAYRAPDEAAGLRSALVVDEPLLIAMHKDDPLRKAKAIQPAQLDQRPWISVVRQPVDTIRPALLAACQRAGFTPDIVYETSDPLSSLHLVSAGLGLAVVQASLGAANASPEIVFRELPWLDLRVRVHLVWRAQEQRPLVARFRGAVLKQRALE
ncbi:LysR substrate-binding domain-containing protein [Acidovorax sp. SUPP2539]|uniref:LysR substrate-binding domain-containing protein n=1 Tax=Acidovorax sp. SUPP2539 TaxID=2920878 RepID=UPI0023DE52D3|nr:LysR substrate-binding domain-containing protein [Acidovorax sp. SUPP2539]GKS88275.1 LysR family transcriptional regulator [Acidovorax sp. SUPP2539]